MEGDEPDALAIRIVNKFELMSIRVWTVVTSYRNNSMCIG
jgi:hypothetical protein